MNLLRFIAGYMAAHAGRCPTLDEMRRALGMSSKSNAQALLDRLEIRGLIQRQPLAKRSIVLLYTPTVPQAPDGAPLHFIPLERLAATVPAR